MGADELGPNSNGIQRILQNPRLAVFSFALLPNYKVQSAAPSKKPRSRAGSQAVCSIKRALTRRPDVPDDSKPNLIKTQSETREAEGGSR